MERSVGCWPCKPVVPVRREESIERGMEKEDIVGEVLPGPPEVREASCRCVECMSREGRGWGWSEGSGGTWSSLSGGGGLVRDGAAAGAGAGVTSSMSQSSSEFPLTRALRGGRGLRAGWVIVGSSISQSSSLFPLHLPFLCWCGWTTCCCCWGCCLGAPLKSGLLPLGRGSAELDALE